MYTSNKPDLVYAENYCAGQDTSTILLTNSDATWNLGQFCQYHKEIIVSYIKRVTMQDQEKWDLNKPIEESY